MNVALVILLVLLAAACDLTSRRIPNVLTYPAVACGLLWGLLHGSFAASAAGLLVGLVPGLLLWRSFGLGAGDAKLLAAIGALMGPAFTAGTWFWSFAAVLLVTVVQAVRRRVFWRTCRALACGALAPILPILRVHATVPALGTGHPLGPWVALVVCALVVAG